MSITTEQANEIIEKINTACARLTDSIAKARAAEEKAGIFLGQFAKNVHGKRATLAAAHAVEFYEIELSILTEQVQNLAASLHSLHRRLDSNNTEEGNE